MNPKEAYEKLNEVLDGYELGTEPASLYEPVRYILNLGGKRLRPILSLLGFRLFSDAPAPPYLPALSVEVFHNFTLMHDDIMDDAPLRRGKTTVHEKWDANTAILSGDAMLIKAYQLLEKVPSTLLPKVLRRFNETALGVCEGQQYDMNFESRDVVEVEEYIHMIKLKTAVLLGFSLELGAILGGASETDQELLYKFGVAAGIGFQLQDDYLDVFGAQEKVGKQVGGDIIANKKTFLLISALEQAQGEQKDLLEKWLSKKDFDKGEKVAAVTEIYKDLGIPEQSRQEMNKYFNSGFEFLQQVSCSEGSKEELISFSKYLIERDK